MYAWTSASGCIRHRSRRRPVICLLFAYYERHKRMNSEAQLPGMPYTIRSLFPSPLARLY